MTLKLSSDCLQEFLPTTLDLNTASLSRGADDKTGAENNNSFHLMTPLEHAGNSNTAFFPRQSKVTQVEPKIRKLDTASSRHLRQRILKLPQSTTPSQLPDFVVVVFIVNVIICRKRRKNNHHQN